MLRIMYDVDRAARGKEKPQIRSLLVVIIWLPPVIVRYSGRKNMTLMMG